MKTSALARCCAALMPLFLMACAALDTVHYAWPGPGRSQVITVDAKQRHLIMTTDSDGKNFRACAEAAPDAFSAFGSSFSLGGLFGASSNEVQAANAFATTAATIERTQTINLLRESFYRTCERLLNREIGEYEFAVLAARDHRSMVAILAVEQMTGVVKAPATIISGPAVSASRAQSEKLLEVLKVYQKERADADDAARSANEAFVKANALHPDNDPAAKPICKADPPPTEAEAKSKYEVCKTAESKAADTKTAAENATKREKAVLDQLEALAAGLSAATKTGTNSAGGLDYDKQEISDVKMALIARSVEKIALTAGIDEALMFCMSYLRSNPALIGDSTRTTCNQVVGFRAAQDAKVTAEISGADAVNHQAIFTAAEEPLAQANAEITAARYQIFRFNLLSALERTSEAQWPDRWGAFVEATQTANAECTSATACRDFVRAGETAFYGEFMFRQAEFTKAATDWLAALEKDAAKTQGETR